MVMAAIGSVIRSTHRWTTTVTRATMVMTVVAMKKVSCCCTAEPRQSPRKCSPHCSHHLCHHHCTPPLWPTPYRPVTAGTTRFPVHTNSWSPVKSVRHSCIVVLLLVGLSRALLVSEMLVASPVLMSPMLYTWLDVALAGSVSLPDLAGSVSSFDLVASSDLAALSVAFHAPVFGFKFNGYSELSAEVRSLHGFKASSSFDDSFGN